MKLLYNKENRLRVRFQEIKGRLQEKQERILSRLLKRPAFALVFRTVQELGHDDATHMAAGVAYYAILSLFPLTMGLIALFSLFLESENVQAELFGFFQTYLPASVGALEDNIESLGRVRGFLGILSLLGLFWTASAMFGAVSRAVNRAWDVHEDRNFVIDKLRHIGMAMSVGVLFLLSVSTTTALQTLGGIELPVVGRLAFLENAGINVGTRFLPFIFSLSIFLMIYKITPNTTTRWKYVWPGALLAAILFDMGKSLFVFYMDNFADYEKVYGSLGSVITLMIWTYASAFILIIGAEFSSEYGRMREGVVRGQLIADRSGEEED